MSAKIIRFDKFTKPHARDDVDSQWLEITDRLNKFKSKIELEFQNVYAAIPAPAAAPGPGNPINGGTSNPPGGGGGPFPPGGTVPTPAFEAPTGAIPGTVYTLSFTPMSNTLILVKNGVTQNPGAGNDYTLAGTTITFSAATNPGDSLLAYYWKAS